MIIYFTGTGNSKFVADFFADKLNDSIISINDVIKNNKTLSCESKTPYIIVAPIYAWRFPLIVEEILQNAQLKGNRTVYCVATMGENSGNTDKCLEKLFTAKGMRFKGFTGIAMQNNYLLMETMPDKTTVKEGINFILPKLEAVAEKIQRGDSLKKDDKTPFAALMTGVVNWGFNTFMLKNQKYSVNERCTACGKCADICPTNNISINNKTAVFDKNCMACFACLHHCPMEAINIEGKTEDKGRYICPDYNEFKQ